MPTPNPQGMTIEAIRSVPLFSSLDDAAARELAILLDDRDIPSGTPLFRAGDRGDSMYLIQSGRVTIAVSDADGKEILLAELAQGDFFGEMAIIDGQQRSADATVIEDAHLSVLSREDFLRFVDGNPVVALEMLSAVFQRLRATDKMLQQRVSRNVNTVYEKSLNGLDRLAIAITDKVGSIGFFLIVAGWTVLWTGYNLLASEVPRLHWPAFDPFPAFVAYLLISNVIQISLMPLIMVGQNLQARHSETRAELDYQVNLKNEIALNEVLRRLDVLESERLPALFAEQNDRLVEIRTPSASGLTA